MTIAPTADSGLPVTVTSADAAVFTVDGMTVTLHATGTCGLLARRPGTANWTAAPTSRSASPSAGAPRASRSRTTADRGRRGSGHPHRHRHVRPAGHVHHGDPRRVHGRRRRRHPRAGRHLHRHADQPGDAGSDPAARVDGTFTVTGDAQTVTFAAPETAALTDGTVTLVATATSGLPVAVTGTTPKVCTVTGPVVTPRTPAVCTVTATQPGDAGHAAAPPVTHTFTVARGAQRITFTSPAGRSYAGGPLTVAPTASSYLRSCSAAAAGACAPSTGT